jgi:predicted kinase
VHLFPFLQQKYQVEFFGASQIYNYIPLTSSIVRDSPLLLYSFLRWADILMENDRLTLVLMAGLPGAGKSTLASALSRELNWHVIDKDRHKELLLKQEIDEEKAGKATYELAFEIARSVLMRQQASVILDSAALHTFILENAQVIVRSVPHAQLKVILCVADRVLRNRRLRDRLAQITAIRVDPSTIVDYLQLFKHLPSDTLVLYTNKSREECLAEAKDYLMS